MYFHTLAFGGAKTDSTADEFIPAAQDPGWNQANANEYLVPSDMEIFAALAANDTITRARIVTPSLRTIGLPEIFPLNVVAEPTVPIGLSEFTPDGGPMLRVNDTVGVQASNGASTVDTAWAALWLRKQRMPIPSGKKTTIRGTATITLVANAWVQGTITFDQTPPVGRYAVIGMHVTCADAWFARLIFPANTTMRPGVVTGETIAGFLQDQPFRSGRLGMWGQFYSVNLPQLEVFGHTAGAETAAVILDIVSLDN